MKRKHLPQGRGMLCLLLGLIHTPLIAQITYEAQDTGNWNNAATWIGGNIPPTTNSSNAITILMQGADKDIFLNGSISITNGNAYNFMINSGTLSIYGDVEINGPCNLTTQGSGKLKIYGNLTLTGATVTCSQLIEVFGNVNISDTGSVNVNGGPFIVHGNYTSSSHTQITPDAVFAVAGNFEGQLASYNANGNLYVGSGNYNLLPPVPPAAICDSDYSGPNTSSQCPVGDFTDLANREPSIYSTYFGSTTLTSYQLTYTINCNTATLTLSGSSDSITYELYRNGVYTGQSQTGTGDSLTFTVNSDGNYMIRATNGTLWRFMNGVAVISLGVLPSITSVTNGSSCGPGTVTLSATANPPTATLYWYTQLSGGTSIGTGTNFVTPSLDTTTNYYVEAQTTPGCISTRHQVVAYIYKVPDVKPITHN
ncbi:MAG: immunoglobulin domain-containing protein [Bacteroidales bacterium]